MDRDIAGFLFLVVLFGLVVLTELLPPGSWLARALDSLSCTCEEDGAGDDAGPDRR